MHLACTIYSKENLVKESIKGTVSVMSHHHAKRSQSLIPNSTWFFLTYYE